MIGAPLNDVACLSKFSQVAADATGTDEVKSLARRFLKDADYHPVPALKGLRNWLRAKAQRDDTGQGPEPRIQCGPVKQRVDYLGREPNCVERSISYTAIAEVIDPDTLRQLATIATPAGLHTFPVESGRQPVVLDPAITHNSLSAGVWSIRNGPGQGAAMAPAFTPREMISWAITLAEDEAKRTHGGPARVRNAGSALARLWDGEPLADSNAEVRNSVADIAWTFALAEQAARLAGGHGVDVVRMTAMGVERLMHQRRFAQMRNLSFSIGGKKLRLDLGRLGSAIGGVGKQAAPLTGPALKAYLLYYGVPPQAVDAVAAVVAEETGADVEQLGLSKKKPTAAQAAQLTLATIAASDAAKKAEAKASPTTQPKAKENR